MLANHGQWKGKVLIKPEVFQELSSIQSFARDRVMPVPMNWRLGYHRILRWVRPPNKVLDTWDITVQRPGVILSVI